MGNCNFRTENNDPSISLTHHQFQFQYPIGKGGFGKVWRVVHKKTKIPYAMKEMQKRRIIHKKSVHSVMNERRLLAILRHPFIVNMRFAFQDRENLYLAMDLMPGGDLRYHLGKQRRFTEEQTRFFIVCILNGLEYLHMNGIIHRDIKPENLVLDEKGYVRLTDFGIARIWQPENGNETSGTPGYMAPEVICRQNHNIQADYFALGVIVYEFMLGRRPYQGKNRKEIRDAILARQAQVRKQEIPEGWSVEAADFANKLLQRKPQQRLGINGPSEVKSHAWLRDVDWQRIFEKRQASPFVPGQENNFDSKQVMNEWKDEAEISEIKESSIQDLFVGYFFDATLQPDNNITQPKEKALKS
ncbi:unnamed protein product [Blepharisma stoltei]|uniref:non-specific serine/threonine protein kinase n=1 Tax=Blepharisma stoltei TaxID=1481888 RepID=A0AAU9IVU9_9CILI|nr:unnamed protein product [Blepharisma stoltei]